MSQDHTEIQETGECPVLLCAWKEKNWNVVKSEKQMHVSIRDFTFTLLFSCTGEGNGNPLQYSCLENPRDDGAWWAAVYVVAHSQTRLKRLSIA